MTTQVLTAGRELDALVAEKVMGWTWVQSELNNEQSILLAPEVTLSHSDHLRLLGRDVKHFVPAYSTDIAAAWTVHQKVMELPFRFRNRYFKALAEEARLDSGPLPDGLWALNVLKDRFPEAICLAALKACGAIQ